MTNSIKKQFDDLKKCLNPSAYDKIKPLIHHDKTIDSVEKWILFKSLDGERVSYLLFGLYLDIKEYCMERYLAFADEHEKRANTPSAEDLRCERTVRILAELLEVLEYHNIHFSVIDRFILLVAIWARDLGWLEPKFDEWKSQREKGEKRPSTYAEIHCELGANFVENNFISMGLRWPDITYQGKTTSFYKYFKKICSGEEIKSNFVKEPKPPSLFPIVYAISQLVYLHDYSYEPSNNRSLHMLRNYEHQNVIIKLVPTLLYLLLDDNDDNKFVDNSYEDRYELLKNKISLYFNDTSLKLSEFEDNYKIDLAKLWSVYRLSLTLDPWNVGELLPKKIKDRSSFLLKYLWDRPRWFVRFENKEIKNKVKDSKNTHEADNCKLILIEIPKSKNKRKSKRISVIEEFLDYQFENCLKYYQIARKDINISRKYIPPLKKDDFTLNNLISCWDTGEFLWRHLDNEELTDKDKTDLDKYLSRLRLEIVTFPLKDYFNLIHHSLADPNYGTIFCIIDAFNLIKERACGICLIVLLNLLVKNCSMEKKMLCTEKNIISYKDRVNPSNGKKAEDLNDDPADYYLCTKIIKSIGRLKYKNGFFIPPEVLQDIDKKISIDEKVKKMNTVEYLNNLPEKVPCLDSESTCLKTDLLDKTIKNTFFKISSNESLAELLRILREEANPKGQNHAITALLNQKETKVSTVFSNITLEYNFWKMCYLSNKKRRTKEEKESFKLLKREFIEYLKSNVDKNQITTIAKRYKKEFLYLLINSKDSDIVNMLIQKQIFYFTNTDIFFIKQNIANWHIFGDWMFNQDILSMKKNAEDLAKNLGIPLLAIYHKKSNMDTLNTSLQNVFHNMSDIENLITISKGNIYKKLFRDHINHSIRVMFLMNKFSEIFSKQFTNVDKKEEFNRIFGITGLLHDIGHPIADSQAVLSAIDDKIQELTKNSELVKESLRSIKGFEATSLKDINLVELIQILPETSLSYCIHGKKIKEENQNQEIIHSSLITNFANIEHDIIGAVMVADILNINLHEIKKIIEKRKHMKNEEIEKFLILQAIALHNMVGLDNLHSKVTFSYMDYPLLISLILCDELQEWGRTLGLGADSIIQEANIEYNPEKSELTEEIKFKQPSVLKQLPVPFEPFFQIAGKYRVFSRLNFKGIPINIKIKTILPNLFDDIYYTHKVQENKHKEIFENERTRSIIVFEDIDIDKLRILNNLCFEISIDNEEESNGKAIFKIKSADEKNKYEENVEIIHEKDNYKDVEKIIIRENK